jgi:hypothetical protein
MVFPKSSWVKRNGHEIRDQAGLGKMLQTILTNDSLK